MSAWPGALDLPAPPNGLTLPVLPDALCKGQDPSLWFPGTGGSMVRAKAVCRACQARVRCLEWAVQAGERAGVWGGTSPDERAQIRAQRQQGTPSARDPASPVRARQLKETRAS